MDPAPLTFPKPTYDPSPSLLQNPPENNYPNTRTNLSSLNNTTDLESQQPPNLLLNNINGAVGKTNSVRTRLFSGLLLLAVLSVIIIVLVATSERGVRRSGRHH